MMNNSQSSNDVEEEIDLTSTTCSTNVKNDELPSSETVQPQKRQKKAQKKANVQRNVQSYNAESVYQAPSGSSTHMPSQWSGPMLHYQPMTLQSTTYIPNAPPPPSYPFHVNQFNNWLSQILSATGTQPYNAFGDITQQTPPTYPNQNSLKSSAAAMPQLNFNYSPMYPPHPQTSTMTDSEAVRNKCDNGQSSAFQTSQNSALQTGQTSAFQTGQNMALQILQNAAHQPGQSSAFQTGLKTAFQTLQNAAHQTGRSSAFQTRPNCVSQTLQKSGDQTGQNSGFQTYDRSAAVQYSAFPTGQNSAFQSYKRSAAGEVGGKLEPSQSNSNSMPVHSTQSASRDVNDTNKGGGTMPRYSNLDVNPVQTNSTNEVNKDENKAATQPNGVNDQIEKTKPLDRAKIVDSRYDFSCIICEEAKRDTVLLPCRHFCVCGFCCESIDLCPLCRKPFASTMTVFT